MKWYDIIGLIAMALTAGGFTTLVVRLLVKAAWSTWIKQAITIAVAAAFGLATSWLAGDVWGLVNTWGDWTAAQIWAWIASVYTAANIWYKSVVQAAGLFAKKKSTG